MACAPRDTNIGWVCMRHRSPTTAKTAGAVSFCGYVVRTCPSVTPTHPKKKTIYSFWFILNAVSKRLCWLWWEGDFIANFCTLIAVDFFPFCFGKGGGASFFDTCWLMVLHYGMRWAPQGWGRIWKRFILCVFVFHPSKEKKEIVACSDAVKKTNWRKSPPIEEEFEQNSFFLWKGVHWIIFPPSSSPLVSTGAKHIPKKKLVAILPSYPDHKIARARKKEEEFGRKRLFFWS